MFFTLLKQHFKMKITKFFTLVFVLLCSMAPACTHAQNDPFVEMQRQMMEMQRRMMQGFQNNPFFGDLMEQGGSDSLGTFFRFDTTFSFKGGRPFRLDTTLSDGSTFKFFFGGDTTAQQFFRGFEHFFGDMPGMDSGFGWDDDQNQMPKDDGHHPGDDGLLPEERLRQKEEKATDKSIDGRQKEQKETKAKSKIKTTRI
jgi:hypothetical protein